MAILIFLDSFLGEDRVCPTPTFGLPMWYRCFLERWPYDGEGILVLTSSHACKKGFCNLIKLQQQDEIRTDFRNSNSALELSWGGEFHSHEEKERCQPCCVPEHRQRRPPSQLQNKAERCDHTRQCRQNSDIKPCCDHSSIFSFGNHLTIVSLLVLLSFLSATPNNNNFPLLIVNSGTR